MNAPATVTSAASLGALLENQRAAFLRDGPPTLAERIADLTKLKSALLARREEFATAVDADFSHRSAYETMIMELVPLVQGIDYLKRNLKGWMRPRRRRVDVSFLPGKARMPLSAAWRRRHHVALELSAVADPDAAGDRHRRGQPRHDQTLRIHAENDRASRRHAGRNLRRGAGRRRQRRP